MELEYFTSREKELLGQRYEALHTPLEAAPARGLTVNGLRPGARAAVEGCGLALAPSPFCPQGYRLTDPVMREMLPLQLLVVARRGDGEAVPAPSSEGADEPA